MSLLGRLAIVLSLALGVASQAETQFSIGISVPGVSIGINTPAYPQFVRVPNYPVYYAPGLQANYFFYDGLYWVYQQDNWYSSSWYDGPWYAVGPQYVPLYVLRIPVRYYRNPPAYFGGWQRDAPPRWGEHWGNDWQRQRSGWERWNRSAAPAPAPLPVYQRQYSGDRYPRVEQQQQALQGRNYRYQPRDAEVQQRYRQQAVPAAAPPARREPQAAPRQSQPQPARPPLQDARPQQAQPPQPQPQQQQADRRESWPEQVRGPAQGQAQDQRKGPGQDKSNNDGKAKGQDKDPQRKN
ncbi:MAG: hypothetical protein ACRC2B_02325 [Rubrivivax sp.]